MPPPPEQSLEQRLAQVESALRSLQTGNWTERASVVNAATGLYVPLGSLAFGMVAATELGTVVLANATPAGAGGSGWAYGSPALDVYVSGGGLLVLAASQVHAQGNKAGMYHSYRLLGPTIEAGGGGAVAVGPSFDRAVNLLDPGYGQGTDVGAGTFGSHTDLAPGWYRVESAYAASWSGGVFTYCTATNRRIAALPF